MEIKIDIETYFINKNGIVNAMNLTRWVQLQVNYLYTLVSWNYPAKFQIGRS